MTAKRITAIALGLGLASVAGAAADWLQFRGPRAAGVLPPGSLPASLEKAWAAELPGEGLSAPVVLGDRVYLTCASGPDQGELHVLCFDSAGGERIWERRFWATGRTMHHEQTSVAGPSPCSDGQRIFALFSSNDLACLDLDGAVIWIRGLTVDYPNASNSLGLASSPVMAGGVLVCQIETDSESFAVGIDPATGTNRWKIPRTKRANWTTPVVLVEPRSGRELVALQGSAGVDAVDPESGSAVWSFGAGASTIPSGAVDGDRYFAVSRGLTALRLGADGTYEELWNAGNLGPGTASVVAGGGRVYSINNAGVLTAADQATGERLWRVRLEGPFDGSPVLAGDLLLAVGRRGGTVQLVDLSGQEGMTVATLELGEEVFSTPAVSAGAVYVRSDHTLWKIVGEAAN
ncbi:PQQ-binding-like beta-propeller repeat protein [soil metagenome]